MSHRTDNLLHADPAAETLRDVIALSSVPAMWLGAEPPRIAESLAAALFATLRPAFALVAFSAPSDERRIVVIHPGEPRLPLPFAQKLHRTLHTWVQSHDPDQLLTLRDVPGFSDVRVAVRPLGFAAELGIVAAGFAPHNAPQRRHHVLLNIGATQATTAIQNAHLLVSSQLAMAERDRTAAELRQQLAASTAINNSLGEGVIIVDRAARITFLNPAAERLLGFTAAELIGKNVHAAIHHKRPDGQPYPEQDCPLLHALRHGKTIRSEDEGFVRRDGTIFSVAVTSAPIVEHDLVTGATYVFRDITDRKRTELALRAAENRKTSILNSSLDGILLTDHRGLILDFNPAAEAIFGYRRAEAIGRPMAELVIPEYLRAAHHEGMARYLATGETRIMGKRIELPALRADGTEFMAEVVIAHIPDTQPPVFTAFIRDISQRLERERTLRFLSDLNEITQPLTEPNEITWTVASLLGRHLDVNRCAYAEVLPDQDEFIITGDYTSDTFSIIGRFKMSDFGADALRLMRENKVFVVEDAASDPRLASNREAYRTTDIRAAICVPLHKAGRFVACMAVNHKTPRTWTPAEIELVRAVVNRCWESLERARVVTALRESEERHRLIVENVKDFAIMSTDLDGRITHWNPGAEELFGWSEEEMTGQMIDRLFTPEDRARGIPGIERINTLEKGHAPDDRWHLRKDGRRIFVTGGTRPVYDHSGKIVGLHKVARDITERKRMEDDLRRAREELEQIVQERTAKLRETVGELEAYSYSIAHDMRAPLRAMQGFSQILLEEQADRLDDDGREHLRRIVNAANRLDNLIQDILTYSKLTRGELERDRVDLDRLVREMIEHYPNFQPPLAEVHVEHPLLPVLGHEASLNQCVSNLVANAVKFIPPGTTPRVRVWTESRDDRVRLWVEDNGIGISEENQQRIFDIFVRVNPDKTFPGTGIGLSIVRKAVERMGGTVGLESQLGHGSRFWVELPKA